MVEQWTHKPLDVGSNPTLATDKTLTFMSVFFYLDMLLRKSHPRHRNQSIDWKRLVFFCLNPLSATDCLMVGWEPTLRRMRGVLVLSGHDV